jgi:hypothetical protein
VGVGQNEQPLPNVRRARFSRCEQARLDVPKSQGEVAFDVLEEDPSGSDLAHDPGDLGPEVSGIRVAAPFSGLAEGLTGITGRDDMNAPAPRSAVEGSQIVPYSRWSQGLVCHPCHESGRSVGFPLDVAHSSIAGLGDVDAEVETAISGAQGKSSQICEVFLGMKSHKARSLIGRSIGDRVRARGPQMAGAGTADPGSGRRGVSRRR